MSDPATGDIQATGITPQTDFKAAASGATSPAKPYMTFPVKPDIAKDIVSKLNKLNFVTSDSKITAEPLPDGGTKHSFIDKRDNQPLAVMKVRGDDATLSLYKSPEALAKRIDSSHVTLGDINEFIQTARALPPPQVALAKP